MKYGLVLSGGGVRGIAHLGVLKALEEKGIRPSEIAGTSAGAIVGAMYAHGYSPDEILHIILKTKFFHAFRPSLSFTGLLRMEALEKILHEYLPVDFGSLKIPLTIGTTNLKQGKTVFFSIGQLLKPILASACVPGIFNPVEIDGVKYIDGGILNNLPVEPLLDKDYAIIGVHTNPINENFIGKNVKNILERTMLLAISGNTKLNASFCDHYIEPPALGEYTAMDISKAEELFKIGYQYTKENSNTFDK